MALSNADVIEMYRLMLLTRRFEEKHSEWCLSERTIEIPHSSIGQEAVGVGACYGLRADDWVMPSLRTRAALFVRGISLKEEMLPTMCAKANGVSGGRSPSHHVGLPEKGVLLGSGIVGASIAVAMGAALAFKVKGSDDVVVDFFGDGASNRGDFHEALNMAGLLKLPIVFICENNRWAEAMPIERQMAIEDIAVRAQSYGFPGVIVDGNDVLAVHAATSEAVARARAGEGPTLIECKTARLRGFSEAPLFSKEPWRPIEEIEVARKNDPLRRFESYLLERGILTRAMIEEFEAQIATDLEEAIAYAEASPDPSPEQCMEGVYATT